MAKSSPVLRWAATTIAVLLLAGIGFCGMRGMFKLYNSTVVLTPQTGEALVVLVVASMIATIVVALSNVRAGTFQFSGLGINFKGLACQALSERRFFAHPLDAERCDAMPFYLRAREEHWLSDKQEEGKIVVLEDNPLWEIHPSDQFATARWLRISTITVSRTEKEGYPYVLTNTMEGETARATYLGESMLGKTTTVKLA